MTLAILLRNEEVGEGEFKHRYYLTEWFQKIFDRLGILLFPVFSDTQIERVEQLCDGLIVSGSATDIPPHYYGREPAFGKEYKIDEFYVDRQLIDLFHKSGKPILGICGGIQSINVAFGGTLLQRIEGHSGRGLRHGLRIREDSFLYEVYNAEEIQVNSYHQQCTDDVAPGFTVTAVSEDGYIEAIERGNIIGVQWHPEVMMDMPFFEKFVQKFF